MNSVPSLSAAHESLENISRLLEERLKIEESYSVQVEDWLTVARTLSAEDPCFSTINALLDTTDQDVFNRRQKENSLRNKLEDIKKSMESFIIKFDPIRNEGSTLEQLERHAEQTLVEAKACHVDWESQKDEAFSFRKTVLRQDYKKRFDDAARVLRKQCSDLHATRSFFKGLLSGNTSSLAIFYQDTVEGIKKFITLFAEWQQSVASTLNACGTKLWHLTDSISSATLTSRLLEMLLEESDSIRDGNSICHTFPQLDEYPNFQHHPKIFGFPLSKHSCPRETELVVRLAKGLLLQTVGSFGSLGAELDTRTSAMLVKMKIEKNWGTNSDEDQQLLGSLSLGECTVLFEELLNSFPEPILNRVEVSRYSLSNSTSDAFGPAGSQHGDEMNLLAVASVHGHPNGEILQAIHNHVVSYPYPIIFDSEWYERLRRLLTRKQRWLDSHFSILIKQYSLYVALLKEVTVIEHPLKQSNGPGQDRLQGAVE